MMFSHSTWDTGLGIAEAIVDHAPMVTNEARTTLHGQGRDWLVLTRSAAERQGCQDTAQLPRVRWMSGRQSLTWHTR